MSSRPYAKERGAWVLSRAGRRPGARRRGERLMLAARRDRRDRAGVGAAGVTEVVTPGIVYRVTHRGGEAGGSAALGVLGLLGLTLGLVLTWPALLLGWALYGAWVALHDKVGKPNPWVPGVTAVVLFAAAWFWWSHTTYSTPGIRIQAQWWALQPALALALTAWLTRAYGWPAVPRKTVGGTDSGTYAGVLDAQITDVEDVAEEADTDNTDTDTDVTASPYAGALDAEITDLDDDPDDEESGGMTEEELAEMYAEIKEEEAEAARHE